MDIADAYYEGTSDNEVAQKRLESEKLRSELAGIKDTEQVRPGRSLSNISSGMDQVNGLTGLGGPNVALLDVNKQQLIELREIKQRLNGRGVIY